MTPGYGFQGDNVSSRKTGLEALALTQMGREIMHEGQEKRVEK